MHIEATAVLAGQPILQIRKLLKRMGSREHCSPQFIEKVLDVDAATAVEVLRMLNEHGYVEQVPGDSPDEWWRTTVKGNALAQASAAPAVTRATAARALDAFLQRVREVNADDDLAYVVERVILFGSYLSEAQKVNDVDVAVQVQRRSDDDAHFRCQCSERVARALDRGRVFSSFMDQVLWPQSEIYHLLKSGSRVIKLHDAELEAPLLAQGLTRIVYPEEMQG